MVGSIPDLMDHINPFQSMTNGYISSNSSSSSNHHLNHLNHRRSSKTIKSNHHIVTAAHNNNNDYCQQKQSKDSFQFDSNGHHHNSSIKQSVSTSSSHRKNHKEWQKVLYKHQGVPDNYVPPTFLKDLRKNVNLRRFHLMEIIIAASIVTQQIILIVILIMMFIYFDSYDQYDHILFTIVALVTIFLYSFIFISSKFQEIIQIKSCLIFLIACFTMSPVLKTLTETISTDTIYAQCTIMAFVHLAFHDYGLDAAMVSQSISLNAIFFASVCLASRLSTTYHAFAFLIFSTDLFVLISLLYQSFERRIKLFTTILFTIITLTIILLTFGLVGFFASIIFVLFINLICPYIFLRMQILKDNIYGPWDEAIIDRNALKFSTKNFRKINQLNGFIHHNHNHHEHHHSTLKTTTHESSNPSSPLSSPLMMNGSNIFSNIFTTTTTDS
uniref:Phosphatidylinositol N-acetylglucosaminyltransferase subunit C-like n=1 Tax=Dermatophagoides pteronyssinus TaxID=6956 RepID=A0A6P6XSY3_DERPT|nr:phosphatidylinositol N-acetylglucosaminyltransferase subunit C-like [Dermatophagoides pteronyssinus]